MRQDLPHPERTFTIGGGFPIILAGVWIILALIIGNAQNQGSSGETSTFSRLQLLHADVSRGEEREGIPLRILEGNVHIQQDTLHLYCDRAIYNPQAHQIVLEGNVKLVQGNTILRAQKITYFETSKIAIAEGNVVVQQPGQLLKTPYLVYNYQTDATRAEQQVEIVDDSQRVIIQAGRGEYLPDQQIAFVEQNSHLLQIDSTLSDTLHIYAHRLTYYFKPRRRAIASRNVQIIQGGVRATCDSIIYSLEDSTAVLRVHPQARQEGNLLTGESMTLFLQGTRVKKIIVQGSNARAVSIADSLQGWQNKLEGKSIVLHLLNGQLHYLEAIQQASSVYYVKDDDQFVGKNNATADTIRVFFKESQVDSIAVIGGAEGVYHPLQATEATAEKP